MLHTSLPYSPALLWSLLCYLFTSAVDSNSTAFVQLSPPPLLTKLLPPIPTVYLFLTIFIFLSFLFSVLCCPHSWHSNLHAVAISPVLSWHHIPSFPLPVNLRKSCVLCARVHTLTPAPKKLIALSPLIKCLKYWRHILIVADGNILWWVIRDIVCSFSLLFAPKIKVQSCAKRRNERGWVKKTKYLFEKKKKKKKKKKTHM